MNELRTPDAAGWEAIRDILYAAELSHNDPKDFAPGGKYEQVAKQIAGLTGGAATPINPVCDLQALHEIRDFLQDIVDGAEITERSRDAATGFVSIMDSQFGAAWPSTDRAGK